MTPRTRWRSCDAACRMAAAPQSTSFRLKIRRSSAHRSMVSAAGLALRRRTFPSARKRRCGRDRRPPGGAVRPTRLPPAWPTMAARRR